MEELRGYLEERFNALDGRLVAMEDRLTGVEDVVRRLGVRLDRVDSDVRSVADGHMLLFEGMTRRHEEIRADMAEVRSLLNVWNDLVSRRLKEYAERLDSLTA